MRYSPGALGGTAVGCAFAGAAIASIIFFFLYRHKPTHQRQPIDHGPSIERRQPSPESLDYQFTPRSRIVLDQLPQAGSADHSNLKEGFSLLETRIENFVYNYTHERPIAAGTVNIYKLRVVLGDDVVDWTSFRWKTHLCGTTNRAAMLKYYIARVLCARIDPKGDPEKTLLPVDVLRMYQATLVANTNNRTQQLVDYWRIISAALLQQQYPLDDLRERDPRFFNIKKACSELQDSLGPFLNQRSEDQISQSLRETVESFAREGYRHFFQTNLTQIRWPSHLSTQIVLFPELVSSFFARIGPTPVNHRVKIKDASIDFLYDSNGEPLKD